MYNFNLFTIIVQLITLSYLAIVEQVSFTGESLKMTPKDKKIKIV
jgi:hypothetical protein